MSTKADDSDLVVAGDHEMDGQPYPGQSSPGASSSSSELRVRRTRRPARFTSTPETPAPKLHCPMCGRPLDYQQTVVSGVKPIERWDYFGCRACGPFVYRDRTRKLRPVSI